MRPVPAQRIGYAHGLLRALGDRGPARPYDVVSGLPPSEVFPPALEEGGAARLKQLVSYACAAGLAEEQGDAVALTDLGRDYVAAGDPEDPFAVSAGQAELLRDELRERHLSDSIWDGAAIGLSLWSTLPEGEWVALADFGRAASHLGGAGWQDESTFEAQGKRLTLLLQDMGLIDERRRPTELGEQSRRALRLPMHPGLRGLAGQLNPGGAEGAAAAAELELAQLGLEGTVRPVVAAEEPEQPAPPSAGPPPLATPAPADVGTPDAPVPDAAEQASDAPLAPPPASGPPPPATPPASAPAAEPASAVPAPPPGASGISMRPAHTLTALRPGDLAAWKAEQDAARTQGKSAKSAKDRPFLDLESLKAAAEKRGLLIDDGVYAAAIAALASGRHLVLTGGAGSGKTTLAVTLAEAAVRRKHAEGFVFTGAERGWSARNVLGRQADGEFQPGLVPAAMSANRWLVVDELDRARLDRSLGPVSTLLGGQSIELPGGEALEPPSGWRMIATMGDIEQVGRTSLALRRRFVFVELPVPTREELEQLIEGWAEGDDVAAAVARRLIAVTGVVELGPGLFRDAIAYVRARRRLAPADENALTAEALAGFVLPQLEGAGEDIAARAARAARVAG